MRCALSLVLVLAAGCSQIFGLEPPVHGTGTDAAGGDGHGPTDSRLSDTASDVDSDGDGVTDRSDNCDAVPNADQRNEDMDAFGDACDACPISTNNADGDGDGVGDMCDPNPGTNGETLRLFETFASGIPTGWTTDGGTWMGMNGDVIGATTSGNQGDLFLPAAYSMKETVTISTTVTSTIGTGFRVVGIKDNAAVGGFAVVCSMLITSNTDTPANTPLNDLFEQPAGTFYQRTPFAWSLNSAMTIVSERDGADYDCTGKQATSSVTTTGVENTSTLNARIGLHVQSDVVQFHWIMVVTTQ